jgi:hypothetical protein
LEPVFNGRGTTQAVQCGVDGRVIEIAQPEPTKLDPDLAGKHRYKLEKSLAVAIPAASAPSSCSLKVADIEIIHPGLVAHEKVDRFRFSLSLDDFTGDELAI